MKGPSLVVLYALLVAGCAGLGQRPHPRTPVEEPGNRAARSERFYKERGIASWYGSEFHERPTAGGETYDMYGMTAAHRTLPLGTWVLVTDLDTHRSVRVRINDRGPFLPDRIIDLSYGAAKKLGILERGTARVELRCPFTERMLRQELGYWVQLGAYEDLALAKASACRLKKEYPNVRLLPSHAYYHVRIGPFRTEQEAECLKELLRKKGESAFVVRDLLPLYEPGNRGDASEAGADSRGSSEAAAHPAVSSTQAPP